MNAFEEMRAFVRIVEAGSLTGAADQLDLAKSAVSRRLAELEKRLGARLLARTTRRLTLTEAGRIYYDRARDVLAAADAADAAVLESTTRLSGKIRLAVPLSFGLRHLGPAIRDFTKAHPDIEFDLDLNDRQVDLVAEGFDLAIRIARLRDSELAARKLTSIRRFVLASPAWWQQHGKPTVPDELARHRSLEYSNVSQSGWRYVGPAGNEGVVQVRPSLRANNGDVLCDLAAAGLGVVLQPSFIAHRAIEAGELVPALLDYDWLALDAWAVYPATRFLPERVRVLVDFLAERFGKEPYWDDCVGQS
jgi:DNA-binding transcriptional LysR family regulator